MTDLYETFQNVNIMLKKYRKYKITSHPLSEKELKRSMQLNQNAKITCINNFGEKTHVYLFAPDSRSATKKDHFSRIIDPLRDEQQEVICITRVPFSSYIKKYISEIDHLRIYNYLHKTFSTEAARGPFCSPHTVLSAEEARKVLIKHLKINPLGLPKISIEDAQVIWIGAGIGQIIKIISNSALTGKACRYRIVTPCSGKIIQDVPDEEDDEDEEADIDEDLVAEEVQESSKEEEDEEDEGDEE